MKSSCKGELIWKEACTSILQVLNGSSSFVRKWRKRWLNQGTSGRRVTLSCGTTFLHINGGLICWLFYPWRIYIYMFWHSANPFDLWLFFERGLVHHKPFWKYQAKPATFLPDNDTTRSDHNTGNFITTLSEQCVGSFTSRRIMNNEELDLSSLSEKTRKSNQM